MADHHRKPSAPATGLELNHSSTGCAVPVALKELKSLKYLFLVVGGCVPSSEAIYDGVNKNVPQCPAPKQMCLVYS